MLTHAVIDALLGAAGMGDIGQHFPDTDERWRDADSIELLRAVRGTLDEAGHGPSNVDARSRAKQPKLAPFRDEMRARDRRARGLEPGAVNVKFTTGERMGFVGRGEGMAALAIATLGAASSQPQPTTQPKRTQLRCAALGCQQGVAQEGGRHLEPSLGCSESARGPEGDDLAVSARP